MLDWFKPVTRVILAMLFLSILSIFILTKQYKNISYLYRHKVMPWTELIICLIGALLCTLTERYHFFELFRLSAGQLQTLEGAV